MIHLAGNNPTERIQRALQEISIYEEEGVDGAIFEDYAREATPKHVYEALQESKKLQSRIARGVNLLRTPYYAFQYALDAGASFVQFDSVQTPDLKIAEYESARKAHRNIAVLGGIGFKYTKPTGNPLEQDLREGMSRCEAIVTTGPGTNIETPLRKLRDYREILGQFPLLVGAGVNIENIRSQMEIADGAIIGSYFKTNNDIEEPVDRRKVRDLISVVRELR